MDFTQKQLKQGKSNLQMVTAALIGIPLINFAVSFLFPISWGPFIFQILMLLASIALSLFTKMGRGNKWYLFAWLMVLSLSMFFLGGQRMLFKEADGGMTAMLTVFSGMVLIGCAIFLGGSESVSAYLDSISKDAEETKAK